MADLPLEDLARATWRKSSRSAVNGCIEVSFVKGHIAIRDSKDPQGAVLVFTPVEWQAFVDGVCDGEFDLPGSSPELPVVQP